MTMLIAICLPMILPHLLKTSLEILDISEQFVPGNAGSLKVHKWKHQTQSKGQSEGQWCNVCKIFVKGNKGSLKETKHKDKAKTDIDNIKTKQIVLILKTNKCQHIFLIYTSLMRSWGLRDLDRKKLIS